jgi:hypothetical protein
MARRFILENYNRRVLETMINIRAMSPGNLSPEILLQHIAEEIGTLKEMYVVGLTHEGQPITWGSGRIDGLSYAILVLQNMAFKQYNEALLKQT